MIEDLRKKVGKWQKIRNDSKNKGNQFALFLSTEFRKADYAPGTKLPSQRELSELFDLSRNTVAKAMFRLHTKGLINSDGIHPPTIRSSQWFPSVSTNWNELADQALFIPTNVNKSGSSDEVVNLSCLCDERWDDYSGIKLASEVLPEVLEKARKGQYPEFYNNYGLLRFREAICEHVRKRGVHCTPDNVFVVSRRLQSYQYIGEVAWGSKTELMMPELSLTYLYGIGHRRVGKRTFLPIQGTSLDITKILNNRKHRFLVLEPTQMKPTGLTIPTVDKERILLTCKRENIPLLEDCYADDLYLDGEPPPPFAAIDNDFSTVIHMGGIPCWAAHGCEVNWIIGPVPLIRYLNQACKRRYLAPSLLPQMIGAELILSGKYEEHLEVQKQRMRLINAWYKEQVAKYLSGIAEIESPMVFGNVWIKLDDRINVRKLYKHRKTIDFTPGFLYGPSDENHIMLRSALPLPVMEEGLKRLASLLTSSSS